ncbi:MAG: DUF2797 domain-containing protein [Methylococcales bacterium]|nr:DUF2797 domain-containing protein [Methylococcales bacterium]
MQGRLEKMVSYHDTPIRYELVLNQQRVPLNQLLGRTITLQHTGLLYCLHCNMPMNKSFNQGYCYPCFSRLAQCDMCMMKPEICHHAAGTCRDNAWAETFCFQPHIVYLSNTSGLKVGITRHTQIPTRWIDQGAIQALPIFKVATRHLSGVIETLIAKHAADKTQWQRMLKHQIKPLNLLAERDRLLAICAKELNALEQTHKGAIEFLADEKVVDLNYPIEVAPLKVTALNFDKTPHISGVLHGIKGQYLLLDKGVLNVRKFGGYNIQFFCYDSTAVRTKD